MTQPNTTGIPEIDALSEAEAKEILAAIHTFMYWDRGCAKNGCSCRDKELAGTETVDLLCGLIPVNDKMLSLGAEPPENGCVYCGAGFDQIDDQGICRHCGFNQARRPGG